MEIRVDLQQKEKIIENFWNGIHFHPTDAVEDEWGQGLIRTMAEDKAASFMRIYAMLEDVVSADENGALHYDFSQNDARMDFLIGQGFDLLICMNFMPDCIAACPGQNIGIPRYKGKRVNNSVPSDYRKWEEICYQYVRHLAERYGEERLSRWRIHCWNEPDHEYWVSSKTCFDYQKDGDSDKITEYVKLYDYFERGVRRACPAVRVGGPSAAFCDDFIRAFIRHAAGEINTADGGKGTRLDFLSIHAYADLPYEGTDGTIHPKNIWKRVQMARRMLDEAGLTETEIIVDEWGAAAGGFLSAKKNPLMWMRENEFYPAFYFRLIDLFTNAKAVPAHMLICLSGQHKSTYDFDGFRSMFTMSGFKKPIYNAYVLASKLGKIRLACGAEGCIPTVNDRGDVIVALYHGGENPRFAPGDESVTLTIGGLSGNYKIRKSVIDSAHSNSYRRWQSMGEPREISGEQRQEIAAAGEIVPEEQQRRCDGEYSEEITLRGHCVVLVEFIRDNKDRLNPDESMERKSFRSADGVEMPYRLFAPDGAEGRLPLVLYLHGSGFRGEDNVRQIENGYIERFINDPSHPCIVAAPQCRMGDSWTGAHRFPIPKDRIFNYDIWGGSPNCVWIKNLADELAEKYHADKNRIYLIGRSMGAHAIWRLNQMFPHWAAASVAIAGGMDPRYLPVYREERFWIFHGSKDTVVPVSTARKMYQSLAADGNEKVRYDEYVGAGHMSIDDMIADRQEMYDWLFAQHREAEPGK